MNKTRLWFLFLSFGAVIVGFVVLWQVKIKLDTRKNTKSELGRMEILRRETLKLPNSSAESSKRIDRAIKLFSNSIVDHDVILLRAITHVGDANNPALIVYYVFEESTEFDLNYSGSPGDAPVLLVKEAQTEHPGLIRYFSI